MRLDMPLHPGPQPGDVCAVRTAGLAAWWIRLGSALRGQPNLDNHIIIVHHRDAAGTLWGIEGRPGGAGWAAVAPYLAGPGGAYAVTNAAQPKTSAQRGAVTAAIEGMLAVGYDWPAIAQDALEDLHLPVLWGEKWHGQVPGHVVCSSLAAWAYEKTGLPGPSTADARHTEPSDWTEFCLARAWNDPGTRDAYHI